MLSIDEAENNKENIFLCLDFNKRKKKKKKKEKKNSVRKVELNEILGEFGIRTKILEKKKINKSKFSQRTS